jgi:hypothetical protein
MKSKEDHRVVESFRCGWLVFKHFCPFFSSVQEYRILYPMVGKLP